MNIGNIKESVAAFLGKSSATFVVGTGGYTPDIILQALNKASRKAQRLHNFLVCSVYGQISVAPTTGGSLDNAVLAGTATATDVHTVDSYYLNVNDNDLPIKAIDKRTLSALSRRKNYDISLTLDERYPADFTERSVQLSSSLPYAYLEGRTVKLWPEQDTTKTLRFDAYSWLPLYTTNTDEDWFCKHGSDYLMWEAVVECNYLTGTFVNNREGTLSPPAKLAQGALEDLIEHDNWMRQQAQIPEYR